jgi:hypothetical protein
MVPSPFDSFVMAVNANPYFIGLMMLALNLGGRFIGLELTRAQEEFLQNVWVRRLLIFVVLFMGTRNILVAFWMWLAVVFLLGYVLNENSSMCIFGSGLPGSKCASAEEGFVPLTPEEKQVYGILKAKIEKGSEPKKEEKPAQLFESRNVVPVNNTLKMKPVEEGTTIPIKPNQMIPLKQGSPLPQAPTQGVISGPVKGAEENFIDTYLENMNALREGFKNPRF